LDSKLEILDSILDTRSLVTLLDNRDRDFWREAKKVGVGTFGPQSKVDGLSQSTDIANLFARQYEELYSCACYDATEMGTLQHDINDKIIADG